jgi:hypothetical protein
MGRLRWIALLLAVVVATGVPLTAFAQDITGLIKLFGIAYVVKQLGPQINDFINNLLLNRRVENRQETKVVPILTIGFGQPGYIGAAQVSGPKGLLDKVQAVAQIEANFSQVFRIKALIPIDSMNPIADGLRRVYGVGVTAIIDIQI